MARTFNIGRGAVTVGSTSMGNCSNFTFSVATQTIEHPVYTSGLRTVELIVIERTYQGSFTTDTISTATLTAGLGSAVSGGSETLQTVSFAGAAGLSDGPRANVSLPNCVLELSSANLINGDNFVQLSLSFKGRLNGSYITASVT